MICTIQAQHLALAIFNTVQTAARCEREERRNCNAGFLQGRDQPFSAQLVDDFKGAEFPVETKAHGFVDHIGAVRHIAHERGGISQGQAHHLGCISAMLAVMR